MKVLGIDVCTGFCSVALLDGDRPLAMKHEGMTRGHAERLAPMVAEVFDDAGIQPNALDALAVTTGPGSFTGARLGVSFVRGLGLALEIPAAGVSVFQVMADIHGGGQVGVALSGKNGSILLQCFDAQSPLAPPVELAPDMAWESLPKSGAFDVIGPCADRTLAAAPDDVRARGNRSECIPVTAEAVVRSAKQPLAKGNTVAPVPLYLRSADAKPQAVVSLN